MMTARTRPRTVTESRVVGAEMTVVEPGPAELDVARHERRRRIEEVVLATASPVAFLLLWQVASRSGWIDARFFPSPTTIASTAKELFESGTLVDAILISSQRVLLGFSLGVVSGLVIGTALGTSRRLRAAFEPLLNALYTVPKLALLPLLLLIFGFGETPKILLIGISVFFFMWISTMEALTSTPHGYLEAARSFRASRWQVYRHVLIPNAVPAIFVGMRLSAGVSVLVLVGVEFVQGNTGLGYLIWNSWSLFIARRMYVGIVVVAVLGLVFMQVITWVGRRLTPWAQKDRTVIHH